MEAANEDIPGIDIAGVGTPSQGHPEILLTIERMAPSVLVLKSSRAVSKVSITMQTEGESTLTVHAEMDNVEAGPVQSASITTSAEQEWPTYQATTYLGKEMADHGKKLEMVPRSSIRVGPIVGAGGFGTVLRGSHNDWGEVAIKKLTADFMDDRTKKKLFNEANKLHCLHHPNIIQMMGVVMEPALYALVLEYMPHGALDAFLEDYEVSWAMKMEFVEGVVLAMNYLHTRSSEIIHKDLKSSNVLVGRDMRVKVSDFGLSNWRSYSENYTNHAQKGLGTVSHVPPEKWRDINLPGTKAYDIYSFGILVWEVCTEALPFHDVPHSQIKEGVKDGQRPALALIPADTPQVLIAIMNDCWQQEPNMRLPFKAVKEALEGDTYRLNKDMKMERLKLMQLVKDGDAQDDGLPQPSVPGPTEALTNGVGRLEVRDGLPTPPRPTPGEQDERAPPSVGRPMERYIRPAQPTSAGEVVGEGRAETVGVGVGVPGTEALSCSVQSLGDYVEPETDGPPTMEGEAGQAARASVNGEALHAETSNTRPGSTTHNTDTPSGVGDVQPAPSPPCTLTVGAGPLPGDTEADAEPESMQSLPSPPEYRPTATESLTGTGRVPGGSRKPEAAARPPPQTMPTQNLPDFMRGFLPNHDQKMPNFAECNSYIVHEKDGIGRTVIYNTEKGKVANSVQIGNNNVMYVNRGPRPTGGTGPSRPHPQPAPAARIAKERATCAGSTKVVDSDNMDLVSKHLGRYWKALGRRLGFSSGELDQINTDYNTEGLAEKIRQMLEKWRLKEGRKATLGVLVDQLWSIERYNIAVMMKEPR